MHASVLSAAGQRVLSTWPSLAGVLCRTPETWVDGVLPLLVNIGVVEQARRPHSALPANGGECAADADGAEELWVRLKPMGEAIAAAEECWRQMGTAAIEDLEWGQTPRRQASERADSSSSRRVDADSKGGTSAASGDAAEHGAVVLEHGTRRAAPAGAVRGPQGHPEGRDREHAIPMAGTSIQ